MDRWSTKSLGERTTAIGVRRSKGTRDKQMVSPLPALRLKPTHNGGEVSDTFQQHSSTTDQPPQKKQPTTKKHLTVAEGVAAARLQRALGILRRLAHQEQTLATLDALERSHIPSSTALSLRLHGDGDATPPDDTSSSAAPPPRVLQRPPDSNAPSDGEDATVPHQFVGMALRGSSRLPPMASVFTSVETQFRQCVDDWTQRRRAACGENATRGGGGASTSCVDDADDDCAVEQAVLAGASLNLSQVPLRVEHLPATVEYISAAASAALVLDHSGSTTGGTAPGRSRGVLPLRALDLTGLHTAVSAGHHVLRHLTTLLQSTKTIVVLHLSDACALSDQQCDALQGLLARNLNGLRTEEAALRQRQRRAVARGLRQGRDDVLNFFLWENAERCGLLELEASLRRQLRQGMLLAAQTTLRRAQEAFTRQRQATARLELFRHATASMEDFFTQSQHGLIRHQLKFLQQQETRARHQIVAVMSTALDVLVTANKSSLHRLSEKVRNASASKRESVLALLRDERQARAKVCGQATAFGLAVSVALHKKYRRGVWKNIVEARCSLFLGPLSMEWTVRRPGGGDSDTLDGVNNQPLVSCVEPSDNDFQRAPPDDEEGGTSAMRNEHSASYRAERRLTTTSMMSKSIGGGGGGGLNDISDVARAVMDAQRAASPAASITGSKRSSIAQSPHGNVHNDNNSISHSPSLSLTQHPTQSTAVVVAAEDGVRVEVAALDDGDAARPQQAEAPPSNDPSAEALEAAVSSSSYSPQAMISADEAPPAAPLPDSMPPQLDSRDGPPHPSSAANVDDEVGTM